MVLRAARMFTRRRHRYWLGETDRVYTLMFGARATGRRRRRLSRLMRLSTVSLSQFLRTPWSSPQPFTTMVLPKLRSTYSIVERQRAANRGTLCSKFSKQKALINLLANLASPSTAISSRLANFATSAQDIGQERLIRNECSIARI